ADRASGHAPALGALRARVGSVAGVALVGRHPDHRPGRLEGAGLHVRAGVLAAEAPSAPLRDDLQDPHACPSWVRARRGAPGGPDADQSQEIANRSYVTQSSQPFNRRGPDLVRGPRSRRRDSGTKFEWAPRRGRLAVAPRSESTWWRTTTMAPRRVSRGAPCDRTCAWSISRHRVSDRQR